MMADLTRPVDPVHDPLFSFLLFKASPNRFFWYARYHHLVMDGFSMWLVARRVAEVYTQLTADQIVTNEPLGSVRTLLAEDIAYRESGELAQDRSYWRDYLSDRPPALSLAHGTPKSGNGF